MVFPDASSRVTFQCYLSSSYMRRVKLGKFSAFYFARNLSSNLLHVYNIMAP